MSLRYTTLRHAVQEAVAYTASCETPPGPLDDEGKERWEELAGLPDDTILENFCETPRTAAPNEVIVENIDELKMTMDILSAMHRGVIPESLIADQVQHEQQHGFAAEYVGFHVVQYGLCIASWNRISFGWQVFQTAHGPSRPITKLMAAAITALPMRPSEGDKLRLRRMGYQDVQDIGRRAVAHNAQARQPVIPTPYSYSEPFSYNGEWL